MTDLIKNSIGWKIYQAHKDAGDDVDLAQVALTLERIRHLGHTLCPPDHVAVPREQIANLLDRIERLAFDVPPPHRFTPQLAGLIIEGRNMITAAEKGDG